MTFLDFCRSHGVIIDALPPEGVWRRYRTEDKPLKKNGAVIYNGDSGALQNWAVHTAPVTWRRDETVRPITAADRQKLAAKRALAAETQEKGWAKAAARAATMLEACKSGQHGYLQRKGFHEASGLVTPEGALFVPMRTLASHELVGAQVIRWLPDVRLWEKRFIPGMRAQGAVFTIGRGRESFLCEGLATGLSIDAALQALKFSACVIVTFSAHNLTVIAERLPKGQRAFVFADHDESKAGEEAARKTGLPWTMAPEVGMDANDWHRKHGVLALAAMLQDLRRRRGSG